MFFDPLLRNFLALSTFLCSILMQAQNNEPPVVTATGNLVYCPLSTTPIVDTFNIVDPDDAEIDAFFVQISVGYQRSFDSLRLTGSHPNITTTWDAQQGKLAIQGIAGGAVPYADLIPAIHALVFESTSLNPTPLKQFSFTIGAANFLPQTGHYYEYIPQFGITWQDAKVAAENRSFFGLQGYLATITSVEEARLSGEQASGVGWIGGSDDESEGIWRWVTGPEAGTIFWNGGINGSTPNFAFWNTAEPNNVIFDFDPTGEDYAHVTHPSIGVVGSWNDLPNVGGTGFYQPQGYVVEYGGLAGDPVLQLSASTSLVTPSIESVQDGTGCGEATVELGAIASQGDVLWFDSEIGGNHLFTGPTFTTPLLTDSTTYYVLASEMGCMEGVRTPVEATILSVPIISSNVTFRNCDEDGVADGFTDFNLMEAIPNITLGNNNLAVSFHSSSIDAEDNSNPLTQLPYNNASGSTVFARAENNLGCYSIAEVTLEVSVTTFPPNFGITLEICDGDERDGIYLFDLESVAPEIIAQFPSGQNLWVDFYRNLDDAILEQNRIQNTSNYANETPFSQTLYVRVENQENGDCFGIGSYLQLEVFPLVEFDLDASGLILCDGSTVTAHVVNPSGQYQYEWRDDDGSVAGTGGQFTFTAGGNYTVTGISADGCASEPREVVVRLSNAPQLTREAILVNDTSENHSIIVLDGDNNIGFGDYEYALDNPFGPFQDSPIFESILPGLHTIYAVDKNGCGAGFIEIGVVGISKFVTPNNDGANDILEILGVTPQDYSSAALFIMDRYGKLVAQVDAFGPGWNGKYNGTILPSSDYWYILDLVDAQGTPHRRTGHFSLKR